MGCCILWIQYVQVLDETNCLNSKSKYPNYGRCGKVWMYPVYNNGLFPASCSWRSRQWCWQRLCMYPIDPQVCTASCLLPDRNLTPCSSLPTHFPPGFCTVIMRTIIFNRSNLIHILWVSVTQKTTCQCSWQCCQVQRPCEATENYCHPCSPFGVFSDN